MNDIEDLFEIIDKETGKTVSMWDLAKKHTRNEYLFDNGDLTISQDGDIILVGNCGDTVWIPVEKYKIKWNIFSDNKGAIKQ